MASFTSPDKQPQDHLLRRAMPLAIAGALVLMAIAVFCLAPRPPKAEKQSSFMPVGLSLTPSDSLDETYNYAVKLMEEKSLSGGAKAQSVYAWKMPQTGFKTRSQLYTALKQKLADCNDKSAQVLTTAEFRKSVAEAQGATFGIELDVAWEAPIKGGRPGYWKTKNVKGSALAAGLKEGDQIVQVDTLPVEVLGNPTGQGNITAAFAKGDLDSLCVISVLRGKNVIDIGVPRVITGYATAVLSSDISNTGNGQEIRKYGIGTVGVANMRRTGIATDVASSIDSLNSQMQSHDGEPGDGNSTGGLKVLVFDVGGAKGGTSLEAAKLAALFIPQGHILTTVRQDVKVSYDIEDGKLWETTTVGQNAPTRKQIETPVYVYQKKLYVAIDQDTEGAAEQVARALQSNLSVEVVGYHSAGKNTFSEAFDIGANLVMRMTTGRYVRQDGNPIVGGVKVDFVMSNSLPPEQRLQLLTDRLIAQNPVDDPPPVDNPDPVTPPEVAPPPTPVTPPPAPKQTEPDPMDD